MQVNGSSQVNHALGAYRAVEPADREADRKTRGHDPTAILNADPRFRIARGRDSLEVSDAGRALLEKTVSQETDPVEQARRGDAAARQSALKAAQRQDEADSAAADLLAGRMRKIDLLA